MGDILTELKAAQRLIPDWSLLDIDKPQGIHIAVMSEPFLSYVFAGKKTIESRFSLYRIAPYGQVKSGDLVFMKNRSIIGYFRIA